MNVEEERRFTVKSVYVSVIYIAEKLSDDHLMHKTINNHITGIKHKFPFFFFEVHRTATQFAF